MPPLNDAEIKRRGVHYTPEPLARFVAERLVANLQNDSAPPSRLRLLDPACGDGRLLEAFLRAAPGGVLEATTVVGVDAQQEAVDRARARLEGVGADSFEFFVGDFLDALGERGSKLPLFAPACSTMAATADVIIANPPYVRTQNLDTDRVKRLAEDCGLKGRLDLYQAFLVAIAETLDDGGVVAAITSNKFLTTKGAGKLREFLLETFEILELIDLGDTRLFDAAVLPAVLVARKVDDTTGCDGTRLIEGRFARIYEAEEIPEESERLDTRHELLRVESSGSYRVGEADYSVVTGELRVPQRPGDPWSILADDQAKWLKRIDEAAAGRLEQLGEVRVGIKTNADEVFVRNDWDDLPADRQPEEELLYPLITHDATARWRPTTAPTQRPRVLYPHHGAHGECRPVDLDEFPRARRYLQAHEPRLRERTYLLDAGRRWYEHWVPHRPDRWSRPKVVFPDISTEMVAFYDDSCIVKGSCYWICPDEPWLVYLLLGLLNSSVLARYHDLAFQNRLYAGRRRYLTQYVKNYPVPPLESAPVQRLCEAAERLVHDSPNAPETERLEDEIDRAVQAAFAL